MFLFMDCHTSMLDSTAISWKCFHMFQPIYLIPNRVSAIIRCKNDPRYSNDRPDYLQSLKYLSNWYPKFFSIGIRSYDLRRNKFDCIFIVIEKNFSWRKNNIFTIILFCDKTNMSFIVSLCLRDSCCLIVLNKFLKYIHWNWKSYVFLLITFRVWVQSKCI